MAEHSVPVMVYAPDRVPEFLAAVAATRVEFDYLACLWFGYILPPPVLDLANVAGINTHPSYLPYNRGKHGNVWAIVEGTPAGGAINYLESGIDTGAVVARVQVQVSPDDTGRTLYDKCVAATEDAFKQSWHKLQSGDCSATTQSELGAGTYHNAKELARLDWLDLDASMRVGELLDLLRARTFPPHPGVRFRRDGRTYHVRVSIEELPAE